jgi:hypothetical protein
MQNYTRYRLFAFFLATPASKKASGKGEYSGRGTNPEAKTPCLASNKQGIKKESRTPSADLV